MTRDATPGDTPPQVPDTTTSGPTRLSFHGRIAEPGAEWQQVTIDMLPDGKGRLRGTWHAFSVWVTGDGAGIDSVQGRTVEVSDLFDDLARLQKQLRGW